MDEVSQWSKLLGVSPDSGSLEVCRAFERLAPMLAPHEFSDSHFYAMPTSALPPKFQTASRFCGGWYHDYAYHWMRPHLPEDRGPGVAVVVKDYRTEQESSKLAELASQVHFAETGKHVPAEEWLQYLPVGNEIDSVCRILTHELAHAVDALCDPDNIRCVLGTLADRPAIAPRVAATFERVIEHSEKQTGPEPQLETHGLRFTRIVAHLDYRLRECGVHVTQSAAGERYHLPAYTECYDALGDEMYLMSQKCFAKILARPAPQKFKRCQQIAAA